MRARAVVVAIVALALAIVCVRLGLWQLSRWQGKRANGEALRAALAAPATPMTSAAASAASADVEHVRAAGHFDESWRLLVSDQWRGDSAGVELVSPLLLENGGAVLVDRGWLPSADGVDARVPALADSGPCRIEGLLEPPPRAGRASAWQRLPDAGAGRWAARWLEPDSARARLPYAIAPRVLVALADSLAPALPRRAAPEAPDPTMHLAYAVQWALFALAFLGGAALVLVRDRPARATSGSRA
jgi:surfeit locus 1 family protein